MFELERNLKLTNELSSLCFATGQVPESTSRHKEQGNVMMNAMVEAVKRARERDDERNGRGSKELSRDSGSSFGLDTRPFNTFTHSVPNSLLLLHTHSSPLDAFFLLIAASRSSTTISIPPAAARISCSRAAGRPLLNSSSHHHTLHNSLSLNGMGEEEGIVG